MNPPPSLRIAKTTKHSIRPWIASLALVMALIIMFPPHAAQAQDITTSLTAHWTLDETSGNSITDSAGSNTGTWTDGTGNNVAEETTTSALGNALNFDGTNDKITIADSATFSFTGDFTISAWVKHSGAAETSSGGEGWRIISQQPISSGSHFLLRILDSSGGTNGLAQFSFNTGSGIHTVNSTTNVKDGNWHLITGMRQGSDILMYIDDALENTVSGVETGTYNISAPTYISSYKGGPEEYFSGYIDDIKIYSRALSAADVAALYEASFNCAPPAGKTGEMIFNDDTKLMQYCNGNDWVTIGSPPASEPRGIIAHLKLDETSGTTAVDSIGSASGTMSGGLTGADNTTSGKVSTALKFNGTDNFITAGNSNIIDGATAVSICFWLNYTKPSVTSDGGIIGTWSQSSGDGWLVWVDDNSSDGKSNTLAFLVGNASLSNTRVTAPSNTITPGIWDHYCTTFEGSTSIAIYKNGTKIIDRVSSVQSAITTSSSPIEIGRTGHNTQAYLNASLDDLRIYNRVLSSTEIQQLHDMGLTCNAPNDNLLAHWKLNETSGTLAADDTGNGKTGTLNGFNATSTVTGKDGTALTFDGTDDYIYIEDLDTSKHLSNYSVSLWFKTTQTANGRFLFRGNSSGCSYNPNLNMGISGKISYGENGCGGENSFTTSQSFNDGEWHFLTSVRDGLDMKLYVDGLQVGGKTITSNSTGLSGKFLIGALYASAQPNPIGHFDGVIDDVRIYNEALSADKINSLYGSTVGNTTCLTLTCTNPYGYEREIVFNDTHNVMQYCNGYDWVAMGPPGNGGGGCSNPNGLQAELIYNQDLNILQYCEGDEWIAITPKIEDQLNSGLIAYWKLDETSNAIIADSSGNGNNGTWSDDADNDVTSETIPAPVSTGLSVDGSNDFITVPHDETLDISDAYTISSWVYFDSSQATSPITPSLIGKNNGGGWGSGWTVGRTSGGGNVVGGKIRLSVQHDRNTNSPNANYSGWHYPVDTWNYVTVSWDGTNVKYYLNGALVDTGTVTIPPNTSSGDLTIGYARSNSYDTYHDGRIDDMRLYNRSLSEAEISALYDLGTIPIENALTVGLVSHWKMDDTSGTPIKDSSLNGNDGTWSDSSGNDVTEEKTNGQIGTAITFDGVDDYIKSSSANNITYPTSFSAWVKTPTAHNGLIVSYERENSSMGTFGLLINSSGTARLSTKVGSSNGVGINSTSNIDTNLWTHIVGVMETGNTGRIYVNGVLENTGAIDAPITGTSHHYIGAINASGSGLIKFFNGSIDDVRIYNRALSDADVTELYNQGIP